MIQIIPSILTSDPNEARELIARCEGVVDRISIDIIDGKFAPNKTVEPDIFFDLDTKLKIDYQLMVDEPINWVEKCIKGGADRIIGHVEKMSDQIAFMAKVQEVGVQVGLALDLPTPVSAIDELILNNLDIVLVMSVPAGFGGQNFDEKVLKKIVKLDEIRSRDKSPFRIQDDGGIVLSEIDDAHFAGADEASIGRRLFEGDLADNIRKFQMAAHKLKL